MRRLTVRAFAGAALLAAGCGGTGGDAPAPRAYTGSWISDTLPSVAGRGRVARLEMRSDTQAVLSTEFIGRGTVFLSGVWRARGNEVSLQPVDIWNRPIAVPLVWRVEGDRLVPVRWNKDLYGEAGIPLRRSVLPGAPAAADTTPREEGR
jgi:hypothetical protein